MFDLFGDSVTTPSCAQSALKKSTINASQGFAELWKAWPSGTRKVAKQQALDKWVRYGCAMEAKHILQHVEWLKTQDDWLRGFVPMPVTYLNQRRWIDWEPPVEKPKEPDALQIIKAHVGTMPSDEIKKRIAKLTKLVS